MFKRKSASSRAGPRRKSTGPPAQGMTEHSAGEARAGEEAGLDGPKDPKAPRQEGENSAGPAPAKKKKKKKKRMGLLTRFLLKLALIAAVVLGVFTFVLGIHIHHGNRMYPFIMDGDLLITYKLDPYHTGDAVAYRNPQTGQTAVSRIVAIGESDVEITEQGSLRINGYNPSESVFYPTHELDGSEVAFPYHMGADGVFLLDDYREIGLDSRAFGEVGEDALLGKVVYVFRRRGI